MSRFKIIAALMLSSIPFFASAQIPLSLTEADSMALVVLFDSTNGMNWTNKTGWKQPGVPLQQWYGVAAANPPGEKEKRVLVLSLAGNNLTGVLPPDIFYDIDKVAHVDLARNNLIGFIPRSVRFLKRLQYFYLQSNQMTGAVPGEFGQLPDLRVLEVSGNNFTSVEPGLGQSKTLSILALSNNQLHWLPDELGDLPASLSLQCGNNRLLHVPRELGRLNELRLNNNQLLNLPDFTDGTPLNQLYVQGNSLKFDDIERNLGAVRNPTMAFNFDYDPQDSVRIYADREGNKVTLSTEPVGGSNRIFTWYLNNRVIAGATDSIHVIPNINVAGKGTYYCRITNTLTPQLTLYSRRIPVNEVPEPFLVRVYQDSLNHKAQPVANTDFQIGRVDLSNLETPIRVIENQFSDANGLLRLRPLDFPAGSAFIIRTRLHQEPAVKGNHHDFENVMFTVYADNLIIDKDGKVSAQTLPASIADTAKVYLSHTSFGFNLLVTIEWPAHQDYVDGLRLAFLNANNLLFDISNGQAFFEKVAVYDDKSFWNDADMRIYASNAQWPEAQHYGIKDRDGILHMPPKHFGSKQANIYRTYREENLNVNAPKHFSTIVHEFGHYGFGFYDEYKDLAMRPVHGSINFGFMDEEPPTGDMQTEMSAFASTRYADTEQYLETAFTCWDFWEDQTLPLLQKFRDARPQLHTPRRLSFGTNQIMAGPNQSLGRPDFSVGDAMEFFDKTIGQDLRRLDFLIKDEKTGQPIPGAQVRVHKQRIRNGLRQTIEQGFANSEARIRLFGAELKDDIEVMSAAGQWKYIKRNIGASSNALQKEPTPSLSNGHAEEFTVFLKTVSGVEPFLSQVAFDAGGTLSYKLLTSQALAPPLVYIFADDVDPDSLKLAAAPGGFEAKFVKDIPASAKLSLQAIDGQRMAFGVPHAFALEQIDSTGFEFISSGSQLRLEIKSGIAKGSRIAVLGSDFPEPRNGLQTIWRRVSPVFSVDVYPAPGPVTGFLSLYYNADSLLPDAADALIIHRWNNNQWTPLPTTFDSRQSIASTPFPGPGIYAAYLDPSKSVLTGVDDDATANAPLQFKLKQNFPNPFNPATQIEFSLPIRQRVTLKIFDVMGRQVRVLLDEVREAGSHSIAFDATTLASGIYFYQLHAGHFTQSLKMVFIR
jgi:hypothetical protein